MHKLSIGVTLSIIGSKVTSLVRTFFTFITRLAIFSELKGRRQTGFWAHRDHVVRIFFALALMG